MDLAKPRMDFGDIAARKSHHGCIPIIASVGTDQNRYANCFSFGHGIGEVSDVVTRYLSSVRIRQMAIRD